MVVSAQAPALLKGLVVTMSVENVDFELPKVNAYCVADGHPNWLVPCCTCGKVHRHGAGDQAVPGTRVAHCQEVPGGAYQLVYAGQANDAMLAKVFGKRFRKDIADAVKSYAREIASWRRSALPAWDRWQANRQREREWQPR